MGQHRAPRGARRATSAPRATVQQGFSPSPQSPEYNGGGKRRAETTGVPGLPSAPVIAGVAALAISAGGAAMASTTAASTATAAPDSTPDTAPQTKAVAATRAKPSVNQASVASLIANRREVVSRDHSRNAAATESQKLQQAATAQVAERDAALAAVSDEAQARAEKIEANQWVLPTSGYRLTARFRQAGGYWSSGYHTGLDFANSSGTPLRAVANGTITAVGYDGSYGNKTVLTLDDGTEIWYAHQTSFNVTVGQKVNGGDQIGLMGSTGNVTGPHLHMEVFLPDGTAVDPYTALVEHGVQP